MRTLPPPSILPSTVMSEAMIDSLRGKPVSERATGAAGLVASSGFDGASNRAGSLASEAVAGVWRVAVLSFQRDMAGTYWGGVNL